MERERVIIFDGEKEQVIGAHYFYQDERIKDLIPNDVTSLFKSTYLYSLANTNIQIIRGLGILEKMILDFYGDVKGSKIINQLKESEL